MKCGLSVWPIDPVLRPTLITNVFKQGRTHVVGGGDIGVWLEYESHENPDIKSDEQKLTVYKLLLQCYNFG